MTKGEFPPIILSFWLSSFSISILNRFTSLTYTLLFKVCAQMQKKNKRLNDIPLVLQQYYRKTEYKRK